MKNSASLNYTLLQESTFNIEVCYVYKHMYLLTERNVDPAEIQ